MATLGLAAMATVLLAIAAMAKFKGIFLYFIAKVKVRGLKC